jgi:hypothetical protein
MSAPAAAWYAARGLRVLPLRPGSKVPLVSEWPRLATTDTRQIGSWWKQCSDAGVGIATGNGLFVLDVDAHHAGDEALRGLEIEHGELPETWRCQTASGGMHAYFRCADSVRNRVHIWPGIDVRGDGGYVVAPPTVLEDGRSYAWESEHAPHEVELASAPSWLLESVVRSDAANCARPTDEWVDLLSNGAAEGTRNEAIARLAGHLLRRRPAARAVLEILRAWNESRCHPPLSDEEVLRTVDSVARLEANRRTQR